MRQAVVIISTIAIAIVIGCGGSGGGGAAATGLTGTSSTTATTATTATSATTATTSTTSGGPGVLVQNRIVYAEAKPDGTVDIRHIGQSGETDTLITTLDANTSAIALNPVVTNQVFFAARPNASAEYRIYRNTTPTVSGAVAVTTATYDFVDQIQVANNGSFLIFSADPGDGTLRLYRVDLTPSIGTATQLDLGEFFFISPQNDQVVYSKSDGGDLDIFVRPLPTGSATRLTDNTVQDAYPQFSKDASKIIFSSARGSDFFDLFQINPDGTSETQLTSTADQSDFGGSWNTTGNSYSFAVASGEATASGLFRRSGSSTAVQLKESNAILATYWTSTDGKFGPGLSAAVNGLRFRRPEFLPPVKFPKVVEPSVPADKKTETQPDK